MTTEATPGALGSNDQLGPNALTYARERVSLLGAGEHMDTVNRALDALEGLPVAALLGGWTFKGFTAWAQGLESEIARLTAALKQANDQAEHFERLWYLTNEDAARYAFAKTLEGQVVTMETFKVRGAAELDQALDDAMMEEAEAHGEPQSAVAAAYGGLVQTPQG
ncbi:MAG: hypothetical protein KA795_16665 [Burkholderiaceae bacterium]|nr:hypothetical protein [Burkholderiaceae bacterium]